MKFLVNLLLLIFCAPSLMAQAEKSAESPSFLMQMVPFIVMFFIFYLLMLRPQVKKQQKQQEFIQKLKKGDRVLTSSGIFGTIEGLTDKYVTLEIAEDVSIRVLKNHVSQPVKEG